MVNTKLYDKFHQFTKSQFSIISDNNFTYQIIIRILKKYIKHKKTVLDIGCGAGTVSLYIGKNYNIQVHGIDISNVAIRQNKQSVINLGLNNVNFTQVDFPNQIINDKFDLILCFEVIEHIKDDHKVINNIYEMLNSNGLLILSTPSKNAPLYKLGLLKDFDTKVGHLRRYSEKQLISIIKKQKFEIISVYKTEGILRNFLFTNIYAGKLIRFLKFPFNYIVTEIDNIFLSLFGESDIFIVARKYGKR